MSLTLVIGCSKASDGCVSSLAQLCAEQGCPDNARAAKLDPETYPQLLALEGAYVIGISTGSGAAQYHFQGAQLVGFWGDTDLVGGDCSSSRSFGTLVADPRELSRQECPEEEPDCRLPCTFNPAWIEAYPLCSEDLLPPE